MITRVSLYTISCFLFTSLILFNSIATYKQFYIIVVKLFTNKLTRLLLINDMLVLLYWFGQSLIWYFFNELKLSESEKIWENSYVTIIETFLALTIFRNDMNLYCLNLFVMTLFVKIFHWGCKLRTSYIENSPEPSDSEYYKVCTLSFLCILIDLAVISYFSYGIYHKGPSVKLFFLTEFIIIFIQILSTFTRLIFFKLPEWERKDTYLFYLDIITDISQSIVYIIFFFVIYYHYGLPIHLIRDIFTTVQSIMKRITDFYNYRRLSSNLENKIPDATPEEFHDKECVICWSKLESAKKLPCGHLFHSNCLKTWLEEATHCPLCRGPIDEEEYKAYIEERNNKNQPQQTQPNQEQIQEETTEDLLLKDIINEVLKEKEREEKVLKEKDVHEMDIKSPMDISKDLKKEFGNSNQVDQIMIEMHIKYLENYKKIIDESIEKLKKIK